mgnify:CR=1 FL=1
MKTKCKTLRLSIIIWIISLILFTVFYFLKIEYLYNIFLGLFGSSFVVFLIAIPEYNTAKRQLLEKIWVEASSLVRNISHIEPIIVHYDEKLIQGCINEYLFNKNENLVRLLGYKDEYQKQLKRILSKEESNNLKKLNNREKEELLNSDYNYEIESVIKSVKESSKEYLNIKNISLDNLNNLIGDLEFFTGEKEFKNIMENIYAPIRDIYNSIKIDVCPHLKSSKNNKGVGNIDYAFEIIMSYQNKQFTKEVKEDKYSTCIIYYDTFVDNMLEKLEQLRAYMYHVKPNTIEKGFLMMSEKSKKR